jgi:PII-like signaling protein
VLGFGADSRLHSARILDLSASLPVVVEIVDVRENIEKLLPFIDEHVVEGLVTLEDIKVIKYRHA